MKHLRYWSLATFAFVLLLLSARACGPDFPTAVFVLPENPDHYDAFVQGHLEVLQPGFHTRHLVVAYRYLTGKPLSADEQKSATAVDGFFLGGGTLGSSNQKPETPSALDLWTKSRAQIDMKDADYPYASEGLRNERSVPGDNYETFTNCLDSAFATANATLTERTRQHGPKEPAVLDWVRGQDAVFSNCSDGKSHRYFGPGEKPPTEPSPHLPAAAPANAPVWLQQDRAYQLAAAHFYALDFDAAISGFRAVAADTASPWSITARYLVARAYIRKASLLPGLAPNGQNTPASIEAAKKDYAASLALAQKELGAMRAEPRMAPMLNDIEGLLDYVNLRLDPQAQSVALAHRFLTPNHPRFRQSLIDFTVLHTSADEGNNIPSLAASADHAAADRAATQDTAQDLVMWVEALNGEDAKTALARWQTTHSTVWLAAALMLTKGAGPATPSLLTAARAVSVTDPAYMTVTYHRLRLSPQTPTTHSEVLALLPQAARSGSSTLNQFTQLAAATSPTLEAWLKTAARLPAGESSSFDLDVEAASLPREDVCGRKPVSYGLFDTDAAVVFNQQMPLRLLAAAAESPILPANLRFQVAQAAWARAVLLDKPEIAHRMSPVLIGCRATWKPVLDAYDSATAPADRHAAGLLALMRFASTEPSVRDGEERRSGFATFDEFRQNWWCSTVPLPTETVDSNPPSWNHGSDAAAATTPPHLPPPSPPFLTANDLAEAKAETAALRAIPNASTYFAQQALAWMQEHPSDPRTPEILGYANRALRSSCRNDPAYDVKPGPTNTATYAHQLFDALHRRYPNSPWTGRYPTWQ